MTAAQQESGARRRAPGSPAARLHALTAIAKAATGARDRSVVLRRTASAARTALGAAALSISVWERDRARVRVLLNDGELADFEEEDPAHEVFPVTDYGSVQALFERGEPYVQDVAQAPDTPGFDAELVALLTRFGKGSCLGAPILLEGRVWGELFVTRSVGEPPYTLADLDFSVAVAAQIAAAIGQAEHLDRVARLAYTDQLTGLGNRRAVDDRLDAALARHHADGTVVSLVVVDVNGLKRINDERGHEAGDRALVHVAGLLATSAGLVPGSLAGRTGGDEFAIVVEGGPADHAVWVAEDLCRRAWAGLADGVSCGVASTGDPVGPVDSPSRLFRLADAAQGRAKRSRARRPVVAGRGLPAEAAFRLAPRHLAGGRAVDRRLVRGSVVVPAAVLDDGLRSLDHDASSTVRGRLEVVADTVARLVDGSGWWVSRVPAGSSVLGTVSFSSYRLLAERRPEHESHSAPDAQFDLAGYPATAAAVEGAGALVAAADKDADPAEVAILDAGGYTAVVLAGGRDRVGDGWLLEVYLDELSADVDGLAPTLRALVACALVGGEPA